MPNYFASIEEMKNDYPINNIYLKKRQLLISCFHVETKQSPYEFTTCSNDGSTRFDKVVSIIMNFNLTQIYI